MPGKNPNGYKPVLRKSAIQEISDFAIEYVKSNEELVQAAAKTGSVEWRTVDVPHVAHMVVVWAGFNDETVLLHINVSDDFARKLNKEYVEKRTQYPGRGEEG